MSKPKRIFISHSSLDRDFVEREIISLLESHGIETWYSKDDIRTGTQWNDQITEGLKSCDWFLVALSSRSLKSRWVKMELNWAFEELPDAVVPVIIEECQWKEFHVWLRSYQCPDFTLNPEEARQALLKAWGIELSTSAPPTTPKQSARPPKPKPSQQDQADRIQVQCPNGHRLTANKSSRGKRAKCPTCSIPFVVPKSGEQASRIAANDPAAVPPPLEVITSSIGMQLKLIPAGEFMMGSLDVEAGARDHEKPQHLVKITKPFYLSVYAVTQEQYEKVMEVRPWQGKAYVKEEPDHPATYVSWNDAVEFCGKLSEQESVEYRLPTEAQWEYACRAETTSVYSFGDDASKLGQHAWYHKNARDIGEQYAHPVGQKLPNSWGLYDMHGNVWEWCWDWYGAYENAEVADPNGPGSGDRRVLRGGSFN